VKKKHILAYNLNMLNRNKIHYFKTPYVDHFLEIRLNQDTWAKIVQVATLKDKSYSWVVRYCLFRLIKRQMRVDFVQQTFPGAKQIKKWKKFGALSRVARSHIYSEQGELGSLHRHKLCLYGQDELMIRMTAGMFNFSMSHLVRLALEWHLDELLRLSNGGVSRFHRLAFYWLGIKLYHDVDLPILSPPDKHFHLKHFDEAYYW